jgi:hypothetical protein
VTGDDVGRVSDPVLGDTDDAKPFGGEGGVRPLYQWERQVTGGAVVLEEDQ